MNKIDSRFLDFSFIVKGIRDEPPTSPKHNDQYIVGYYPTGDFAGRDNNIARYDNDKGWVFIHPQDCTGVYDICANEIWYWNGIWKKALGKNLIRYASNVMHERNDTPTTLEDNNGEYRYFDNTTNEVFYYQAGDWVKDNYTIGESILVVDGTYFYQRYCNGETFEKERNCDRLDDGGIFVVENLKLEYNNGSIKITTEYDTTFIYLFLTSQAFIRIYPSDTSNTASAGKEFYTETHTLTAQEVSDKSFTLSYSVESGEETNILCSVLGVIQPASVAFEVSGDTLSWYNKTLDGLLNSGDVFVVHYVKASA